ncbi:MAG: EAL domain-containing protein [Candidatus Dactylopiibacterium sp.]|nr:EAL domain-containing protein [Candidatus Dactylopiibacterium sp.]
MTSAQDESSSDAPQCSILRLARQQALWKGDLDDALRACTRGLADALALAEASVWRLDPPTDTLLCRMSFTRTEGFTHGAQRPRAALAPDASLLDAGEPFALPARMDDAGAALCIGLHEAGQLTGLLCLRARAGASVTSETWHPFARAAAGLLAEVCARHPRPQAVEGEHRSSLNIVLELANALHRTADPRRIAAQALQVLQQLTRAPHLAMYLVEENGEHYALAGSLGFTPEQDAARQRLPLQASVSAIAYSEDRIIHCADALNHPDIAPEVRDHLLAGNHGAMTVLPLTHQGKALGSVGLVYDAPGHTPDAELQEVLSAVSQTVALALANAAGMRELAFQATHDSLTGLPNRTQLHQTTSDALRALAGSARQFALLLLDLDRFKEVNDTLGHRTGDKLLRLVADRLQAALPAGGVTLARLGGDEFAVLMHAIQGPAEALAMAQQLSALLSEPIEVEGIFIEIGASIGVALYPQHGGTSHALLRCADVAMYAAKNSVGRVSVYDNVHDAHNPHRLAMITELGAAIRGGQLVLHYQPRYHLQTQRWMGAEALVRWQHPRLGFIPPGNFVQFAETSELIRPLTLWVARQTARQLAQWQADGLNVAASINLSTRNLLDSALPDALAGLLGEYGLRPESLELEITETALMTDPDRAMQVVARLASLGMRLSIDDFGSGYSSLAYLKRLPLHSLKIDRSFVLDMLQGDQDAIIVRSTIALAHSLGLQVVAEGVEDLATLNRLRDFGCDEVQGFVLARPLLPEQAARVMRAPPAVLATQLDRMEGAACQN